MGRAPCCSKVGLQRGPWTNEEDAWLTKYIQCHGEGDWRNVPKNAGLLRCGKSCRLRWMNYLRPDIKRGNIGPDEEDLIIRLHALLGNRWSLIAGRLPGRTDNEIKNYWNSHLSKSMLKIPGPDSRHNNSKPTSKHPRSTQKKTAKGIEIQTPKPIRITSIFTNPNILETSEGSDCKTGTPTSEEEKGVDGVDNFDIDWSVVKEGGLWVEEDDHDLNHVVACDFPSQDYLLARIYQEYSQLLNSEADQLPMIPFNESLSV